MADKSSGASPFEGIGMLSNVTSATAHETKQWAKATKQQLGIKTQKSLPRNLSQTKKIEELEQEEEEKKSQEIARLNREIQQIIQQHQMEVKKWDEKLIENQAKEKTAGEQQKEEEEKAKKEEERKKLTQPVALPGSKPKTPLSVTISATKTERKTRIGG